VLRGYEEQISPRAPITTVDPAVLKWKGYVPLIASFLEDPQGDVRMRAAFALWALLREEGQGEADVSRAQSWWAEHRDDPAYAGGEEETGERK
jgi:hypothetical protein